MGGRVSPPLPLLDNYLTLTFAVHEPEEGFAVQNPTICPSSVDAQARVAPAVVVVQRAEPSTAPPPVATVTGIPLPQTAIEPLDPAAIAVG